ncbi:MAG: ribosomal protein S5 [uncultured bacterium]|uniref:Small ribosomal subunit protein uS5 n=1 Tax=Candidatus Magasanikbacteria bacterium RIFOXYD2_FULL_36_9 TaxID=1798707 RepID=A0A1F6P1Z4_9BACT|nr:MAG: ribosomal protein S5 [uncultured bacterium]OGH90003.1 MAG: 30S ribosomal protein S5 [Candidatus Magasanikbacteria bacterium RIFOXYD2_FULL_36_9]
MQKSFKRPGREKEKSEFDSNILDLARVTRVTEGGKHMSFRALVVVGDRKGRVGFGVEKGKDVQIGVDKATRQAKKNLIKVPIVNETIPHAVYMKFKAAKVMLKPAPKGSGIIAGGAVRVVLDLAGVPNVSSKIIGKTKNKITIIKATFEALKALQVSAPRHNTRPTPVATSPVKEVKAEVKVSADKTSKIKK